MTDLRAPAGGRARPAHDYRMPVIGAGAWTGGLIAAVVPGAPVALAVGALVVGAGALALGRRAPDVARLVLAVGLAAIAVAGGALLRQQGVASGPVPAYAAERAVAELEGTVQSDPRVVPGQWADQVVVRVRLRKVTVRGATYRLGAVVVVLGGVGWSDVTLGERVRTVGRLAPADDAGVAALVTGARDPVRIRGPDPWWRASAAVRGSIRAAVAGRPPAQAALVPALVDGDDAALDPGLEADFRTTGLTHLTAVSGTNLTLLVGFLLLLARPLGIRGRWLTLVGLLGIVGFVLVARTEPSVVRAAAMGVVGLFAIGTDGRRRGLRALGVAITGVLLVSPGLAVSAGFALSVLATGGIVLLGPPLQAALGRWLPAPIAMAVAVPFAAQLACTPLVAGLSGQVSLVAVVANVLVAPAVGPATVLGLAAGLVGLVAAPLGRFVGTGAGWCVSWIIAVAEHGADLPGASVGWDTGSSAIAWLSVLCLLGAVVAPRVLRSRRLGIAVCVVMIVVLVGVPARIGSLPGSWPPSGWVLVACDVGQGDALAVAVGPGSALVVDAGPDAESVDRCLDRLGVVEVPLLVLTHFHADHVDGIEGVLRDRRVRAVEVSPMLDPPAGVTRVTGALRDAGVDAALSPSGTTRRYGDAVVQTLWPDLSTPDAGPGDGSAANDASVVLLVEIHGLRLLLTGDVEPDAQRRLAAALPGLDVDVLKVPHHGSRYQDLDWLRSLTPEVALVSVGADNDYGHPDPGLLDALRAAGAAVARTDQDGDVAVVVAEEGEPAVVGAE